MSEHGSETSRKSEGVIRTGDRFGDAWVQATGHLANSVLEVNRATLAAFGFGAQDVDTGDRSVVHERPDWSTERSVTSRADLEVGDTVSFSKRFSEDDVEAFAAVSGDTSRLHLDEEHARETRFGQRIVHGMLVSGLISAALARLPGMTIYLSQEMQFTAPAEIGIRLTATVEVLEDIGGGRYRLATDVVDEDGETCITGEAVVLIDELPDRGADDSHES